MKAPVRVAVTGAAGQIGYALLFRIAAGEMLGIYRDALRTYGMWSYRSAPLIER